MSIDPNTGLVTWKPTSAQLGSNPVAIRVDDGRGLAVVQSFPINVKPQAMNYPPTITSNPPFNAIVGKTYVYDLKGTDPDNDLLVWTLDVKPNGMSIDPSLGTLRRIPASPQLGSQSIVIRATDPGGAFATQSYTITVCAVNLPPAITSTPPTQAYQGEAYAYAVAATDPENDALTFQLTSKPAGMVIDFQTGLIQWTPTTTQLGPFGVAIKVDDGQGGTATQTYTVVVKDTASNLSPVITSTPAFVATVGQTYQYQVTATDPEGQPLTYILLVNPANMTIDHAPAWSRGLPVPRTSVPTQLLSERSTRWRGRLAVVRHHRQPGQ